MDFRYDYFIPKAQTVLKVMLLYDVCGKENLGIKDGIIYTEAQGYYVSQLWI